MVIFATGLNYKTAPVNIREKFAISESSYQDVINNISQIEQIYEICLISTCNRVEFYGVATDDIDNLKKEILRKLSQFSNIPVFELEKYIFFYTDREAIRHIFRVSSSLDSMVIGEPQIVCQFKESFLKAIELKTARHIMTKLFDKAMQVSKKIRTKTGISKRAVSISYAAVQLAKKIFGDLSDKNVLLIGAGEMAELAAKHLMATGVKHIFVSNRTFEKAVELANHFSGSAIRFDKITEFLPEVDIVITSTGANKPILTKEDIKKAIKDRQNPIFIIDISVPRNVEEEVNKLEGVYLYNIDDLKNIVNSNLEERKLEAITAQMILEEEINKFEKWLAVQKVAPLITQIREYAEQIKQYQLSKLFQKLPYLSEEEKQQIELAMNSLINKLLHRPTMYIKQKVEKDENSLKDLQEIFSPKWDYRKSEKNKVENE